MKNLLTFSLLLCMSLCACRQKSSSATTHPDRYDSIARDIALMADTFAKGMSGDSMDYFDFAELTTAGDTLAYDYHEWLSHEPLYSKASRRYRYTDSLHVYQLCAGPSVRYYDYDQYPDPGSPQYHDGVMVAGQYFNIDSLHYELSEHHADPGYSAQVGVSGSHIFHMRHTYVTFEYIDFRGSSSCPWTIVFFFELRDHKVYRVHELMLHCAATIRSLGDFDKDGIIDFADVEYDGHFRPEVHCRTLTDSGFVLIPDRYIPLPHPIGGWYRRPHDFSHWF